MKETQRNWKIINAMTTLTEDLENAGIEFAIFKSIRPYPSTTVDIDTIIFTKYKKAYLYLRKRGYPKLGVGPETITLQDPTHTVGIDLYREIAVSRIIYLDKNQLKPYTTEITLPNQKQAQTLQPEADLTTIIAHLLIKEQIFTLADYYTIIHHLKNINIEKLRKIARTTNTTKPLNITLNLIEKTQKNFITLPKKFKPAELTQAIIQKLENKKTQKSLIAQFLYLTNKNFIKIFIQQTIEHIKRKTY